MYKVNDTISNSKYMNENYILDEINSKTRVNKDESDCLTHLTVYSTEYLKV